MTAGFRAALATGSGLALAGFVLALILIRGLAEDDGTGEPHQPTKGRS